MKAVKPEPKKWGCLWLDELSTVEAAAAAKAGTVIIFPIGTVEEHGSHLPLCTDSIQPEYVALEVAKRTGCLVAPPFRHGVCNVGRNFPGTMSIGFDTLRLVVHDVLAELVRNGFRRIIVLTGHSGSSHMTALHLAAQEIVRENAGSSKKARVMVVADFDLGVKLLKELGLPENDGHAAALETSRVMDIRPDLVKGKGKSGKMNTPRFEVVADPERYFIGGVNGDPTLASAEKGKAVNAYIIEQVAKLVEELACRI
jgi:creatinine amidohydrolase